MNSNWCYSPETPNLGQIRRFLEPYEISIVKIYRIMHELPWKTNFWSRVRWFTEWSESPHEWLKRSLFMVTNVLFYFLHVILCPEHIIPLKNYRSLISPLSPRTVFFTLSIVTSPQLICDFTRTRVTGIMTSYLLIVLERPNWGKDDLHKWITTVNISFSPPGIHDLACKKTWSWDCLIL